MDSLSQFALGAAIGVAVMGRRTAVWKAAVWGGICATLPDLDSLIDHGDPVSNMVLHRADSHSLFWLSLAAPLLAWLPARLHRQPQLFRHWWLMVWLALVTHPLLDLMTVYGTQLGRPFTAHPFAVGSIFIIDPLYTLPLLVGVAIALVVGSRRGLRWNAIGLFASTAYLGWSLAAQQHVTTIAERALTEQGIASSRLLVTPTAFNTVLWRVLVMTPGGYQEGFYSLLDAEPGISFDRFEGGDPLFAALSGHAPVAQIARFSHGFYAMSQRGNQVLVSDLRMGQQPNYIFSFVVGRQQADGRIEPLAIAGRAGSRPDMATVLDWMWRRAGGARIAPPREGGISANF